MAPVRTVAAAADGWGTIKGKVVWGGDQLPAVSNVDVTKDQEWCLAEGPIPGETVVVDPSTKGITNVFAYLKFKGKATIHPDYPQTVDDVKAAYAKQFEADNKVAWADLHQAIADKKVDLKKLKAPVLLDQVRCRYVPHALAVREGEPTLVLNPEPIAHNVKVSDVFGKNDANPNMPPGTYQVFEWVPSTQPLNIQCSIHGWMQGYAMVFDHPYFAVTDKDGSFEIKNVPAGEVTLLLRNPKYIDPVKGGKGTSKGATLTVKPGETLDLGEIKYSGE